MIKVIYHKSDFDGIFCREVAKLHFGIIKAEVDYIGWDYGDDIPNVDENDTLYILDLAIPELMNHKNLIWIDHHISNINKYNENIEGFRIDGVAASRLTWAYFNYELKDLPKKEDFINRLVYKEPLALTLIGEHDVWDHKDPNSIILQFGLLAEKQIDFSLLLSRSEHSYVYLGNLIKNGKYIMEYVDKQNENLVKENSYIIEFNGLKFLTVNSTIRSSLIFKSLDKPESGHDALMRYHYNGKTWKFSLYHASHRKDIDLSLIAKKYNGGGHKGACGFECEFLPIEIENF